MNTQRALDLFTEFILIAILIMSPFLGGSVGIPAVTMIVLAAFFILYAWLLKSIEEGRLESLSLSMTKPLLLFLLFIMLQYFFVDFFIRGFVLGEIYRQKMKGEVLKLISYLIIFYFVLNEFQDRRRIYRLISLLVITGVVISVFGIIRKVSQPPLDTSFASFPNRNHFANYVNMIAFLALGSIFSWFPFLRDSIEGFSKESVVKGILATFQKGIWLYIFGLIIMASGIFYSLSRGGMFSFCCGLVFFSAVTLLKGLTKRGYLFLVLILVFTAGVLLWINAPEQIAKRFSAVDTAEGSLAEQFLGSRKIFAEKALGLFSDYPVFGVGFGALEFIYNKSYSPKLMYVDVYYYVDHIHNDFLELLCEVGIGGFSLLSIAVLLYIFTIFKILWKRRDPFVVGVTTGAVSGVFSMCLHSLFDFNFHITSNAVLFFVLAGLALAVINSQARGVKGEAHLKTRSVAIKTPLFKTLLLIVAGGAFLYIATIIVKPYLAYEASRYENIDSLKKAVRLEPSNDKYHFLLAKSFVEEAKAEREIEKGFVPQALEEIKEAIRLNPWSDYYPVYLNWIIETFTLSKDFGTEPKP